MWTSGQITARPYVQFVMGVKNAMPADRDVFNYYIHTVHRLFGPEVAQCAAGIGSAQLTLNEWSVSSGGHARTGLAAALGLTDPGQSWHSECDSLVAFAASMANLTTSLGKMGEDLILLSQSGIGEVAVSGAGGSATMPQKQNPVTPSVLVALARQTAGLAATMQGAARHRQQRDGAAWFTEWLTLPQLCISTGRALSLGLDVVLRLTTPNPAAMQSGLAAAVASLAAEVRAGQGDLIALARAKWPDLILPQGLGTAPDDARAVAKEALALQGLLKFRIPSWVGK